MSSSWGYLPADQDKHNDSQSTRSVMGAEERRRWSSFVRKDLIDSTCQRLAKPDSYGVVIFGPRGVGKSRLSKSVEASLASTTYTIHLYGTDLNRAVAYGAWGLYLARMENFTAESPLSIIHGIAELVTADAQGRGILLILDDVSGLDTASVAVVMYLILSGAAKLLVLARTTDELPEDMVWLLKDHLLDYVALKNFTKAEVRELLTMAMGGMVAASVVEFLHSSSGGNPLVLHALVHEEINRGRITQHKSIWVLNTALNDSPSSVLEDLVMSRLARESAEVRRGIEKMALIRRAPLSLVLDVLGSTVVGDMEERRYLHISEKDRNYTSLSEPHIGETIRALMSAEDKAVLYKEIQAFLSVGPETLQDQELLMFAAWAEEAGMTLEPDVAVAAGQVAVTYFDPRLALNCTLSVADNTVLGVHAAMVRSAAYLVLAEYRKAVAELESSKEHAESQLGPVDYAAWVGAYCDALLWVDGGAQRVPEIIDAARAKLHEMMPHDASQHQHQQQQQDQDQEQHQDQDQEQEQLLTLNRQLDPRRHQVFNCLNLAMFRYQVHVGLLVEAAPGLETGYKNSTDLNYRYECGSLLVLVWAVTGRELDSISLAEDIDREAAADQGSLQEIGLYNHRHGLVLALMWTGRWRESVSTTNEMLSTMRKSTEFHGGVAELRMGIAYTYAGKAAEAVDILVVAAAQLEIRDMFNSTQLAYSALAFALAQVQETKEAERYLALAASLKPTTSWVNNAMSKFFTLMARRWMDNPRAAEELIESAAEDQAAGRFTMASMSLFAATMEGQDRYLRDLIDVSSKRQGAMAALITKLANACLQKDPGQALDAAQLAEELQLELVECRCAVMALDFARLAGQTRLAREAEARIERLRETVPVMPLEPHTEGERLTQRERQVAKLAGRGLGNRAIAEMMGVSVRTVEGHLYQVFSKFGISSRSELS